MAIYTTSPIFSERLTIATGDGAVKSATPLYDNCITLIILNVGSNAWFSLVSSTNIPASLTASTACFAKTDYTLTLNIGPASGRTGGNVLVFQHFNSGLPDVDVYISQICQTGV